MMFKADTSCDLRDRNRVTVRENGQQEMKDF